MILLIYIYIDKFLWKLITTILAVILVPASTWFIMNSLRKARETVIPADESINIRIQSLVKIYERENRWAREWKAGKRIRERLGLEKKFTFTEGYDPGSMADSLAGIIIYFTYFYLNKGFWIFVFSMATWFLLSGIWTSFSELIEQPYSKWEKKMAEKDYRG